MLNPIRKCVLFFRNAGQLFHVGFLALEQLVGFRIANPGCRVRLGILDDELQRQRVAIHALEPFDQVNVVAVRIAVKIEPAFFREGDGIHNESVTLPFADRVAHPGGRGIRGMASPVGPDLAPFMLALEEHESSFRRLKNFKRLRKKQDAWNPGRIAFQDRIVPAGLRFGAVAGFCHLVFRFCPRGHGRSVLAWRCIDTLAGEAQKKFPHS